MTTETKHMPSEREIEAAAKALANSFCQHWFYSGSLMNRLGVFLDCVNGSAAWRREAEAALTAASQSRAADQSERIRELEAENETLARLVEHQKSVIDFYATGAAEAALAEARKVIEPFTFREVMIDGMPDYELVRCAIPAEHVFAARDWRTRNPESSNAK